MDITPELKCDIDNSAKDNIPDMFKQYNELYTSMIHVFDSGLGIDLRRNTYK